MPQLSAAQWAAVRVIYETSPVMVTVTAAGMGTTDRTIRRHARKESWVRYRPPARNAAPELFATGESVAAGEADALADLPETGPEVSLEDIRQRLAATLPRQLAQIVALAERGVIDKPRIDALLAMGRILEQSEAAAQAPAADQQKRSDDELAAMLERIDERIIELAQAYAEGLGGGEHRDRRG